jgi:hypothetical protein
LRRKEAFGLLPPRHGRYLRGQLLVHGSSAVTSTRSDSSARRDPS